MKKLNLNMWKARLLSYVEVRLFWTQMLHTSIELNLAVVKFKYAVKK